MLSGENGIQIKEIIYLLYDEEAVFSMNSTEV